MDDGDLFDDEDPLDWREYIHADPGVLVGKPTIKGTRISVELILELVASNWTRAEMFENYPRLTETHIRAALAFALEAIRQYPLAELAPASQS